MATITEDYVSFETAKLLKEKGFDELCAWQYYTYWEGEKLKSYKNPILLSKITNNSNVIGRDNVTAPTLQMAMKWLREKHHLSIEISFFCQLSESGKQTWRGWAARKVNLDCVVGSVFLIGRYETYEEACEKGIRYTLENLI